MTLRDERLARLKAADEQVSPKLYDELATQARIVASNLFLGCGDKACLSATGFVYSIIQTHEAALQWLLVEGWIELTDKGLISVSELAEREVSTAEAPASASSVDRGPSAYL